MCFRSHVSVLVLTGICVFGVANVGCDRHGSNKVHTQTRPTPEQTFNEIAQLVKDGIVDSRGLPNAYVFTSGTTRSQATVHNEVTSELIPPAKPDEPYRGTITITTRLLYSMRRSPEEGAERSKDDAGSKAAAGSSDTTASNGFDVIDKDLVTTAPDTGKSTSTGTATVSRREDEDVRKCDLVYENNRWVLKTELSKDTEQSLIAAFNRALSSQP